uniref:Transactivator n=1 Tax=Otarine gammaherpesvirus 4 TaxID=2801541 RepID=A0A889IW19_9GAMA|nr:Transactivator [Otarine gammaherpesvirus 4]
MPRPTCVDEFINLSPDVKARIYKLLQVYHAALTNPNSNGEQITVDTHQACADIVQEASSSEYLGGLIATLNLCNLWTLYRNYRSKQRSSVAMLLSCASFSAHAVRHIMEKLIFETDKFFICAFCSGVAVPKELALAMFKLLSEVRQRALGQSRMFGTGRVQLMITGKALVDVYSRLRDQGGISEALRRYCELIFRPPLVDSLFKPIYEREEDVRAGKHMRGELVQAPPRRRAPNRSVFSDAETRFKYVIPDCLMMETNTQGDRVYDNPDFSAILQHDEYWVDVGGGCSSYRRGLATPQVCSLEEHVNCVKVPVPPCEPLLHSTHVLLPQEPTFTSNSVELHNADDTHFDGDICDVPMDAVLRVAAAAAGIVPNTECNQSSSTQVEDSVALNDLNSLSCSQRLPNMSYKRKQSAENYQPSGQECLEAPCKVPRVEGALRPFHPPGSRWAHLSLRDSCLIRANQLMVQRPLSTELPAELPDSSENVVEHGVSEMAAVSAAELVPKPIHPDEVIPVSVSTPCNHACEEWEYGVKPTELQNSCGLSGDVFMCSDEAVAIIRDLSEACTTLTVENNTDNDYRYVDAPCSEDSGFGDAPTESHYDGATMECPPSPTLFDFLDRLMEDTVAHQQAPPKLKQCDSVSTALWEDMPSPPTPPTPLLDECPYDFVDSDYAASAFGHIFSSLVDEFVAGVW